MTRNVHDFAPADPGAFEQEPVGFDWTAGLLPGEAITTVNVIINVVDGVDLTPVAHLLAAPSINGNVVSQAIGGLVPGVVYNLTFTITTNFGNTWTQNAHLPCVPVI